MDITGGPGSLVTGSGPNNVIGVLPRGTRMEKDGHQIRIPIQYNDETRLGGYEGIVLVSFQFRKMVGSSGMCQSEPLEG